MELKRLCGCMPCMPRPVSIEPLWNWNYSGLVAKSITLGINRTFMELKHRQNRQTGTHVLYQSNLYGIETGLKCCGVTVSTCINRTFMELKQVSLCLDSVLLYVSIEPLWNWNSPLMCHERRRQRVSIEPLWNWNGSLRRSARLISSRINRTFMELKQTCARCIRQSLAVSIEPLWNWNDSKAHTLGALLCINRTFMELKLRVC